jgi:hypothetical protein
VTSLNHKVVHSLEWVLKVDLTAAKVAWADKARVPAVLKAEAKAVTWAEAILTWTSKVVIKAVVAAPEPETQVAAEAIATWAVLPAADKVVCNPLLPIANDSC